MNMNRAVKSGAPAIGMAALLALACLCAGCGGETKRERPARARPGVDFVACLRALTNTTALCETPRGTPHMVSTYDRTGGNSDWADLRMMRRDGLCVLADLKGPGCVKRVWTTNVPAKEWLFFLDGETEPRIKAEEGTLFGEKDPFLPPLCGAVSGGGYFYMPVPFRKSVQIAVRMPDLNPNMRPYFQINYETYDESVEVESFPRDLSPGQRKLLEDVRDFWRRKSEIATQTVAACSVRTNGVIRPGESIAGFRHEGPGMLGAFWVRLADRPGMTATERWRRSREVALLMYWDGGAEPSVAAPIGDFFCNGLHRQRFSSLFASCLDDAWVSRFPMPFRKGARAELKNDGPAPVAFEAGWDIRPLPPSSEKELNYFHACWNSSVSSGVPFRLLRAEGRGHYVGCYLMATGTDGTWNMLEGDDSIRVNGEMIPSFHGTGLEDYFNGGWYYCGLFELPLHGLVEKAPISTSQYRFHLADPVAFQNGAQVNFEFGDGNMARGYMASVAYWYQPEPHPAGPLPAADARFPPRDPLEPSSVMCRLYELERIGHLEEARERSQFFSERFARTPYGPVLALRALAYREALQGYAAVSNAYAEIKRTLPSTPAAEQAERLMWFHEDSNRALVGTLGYSRFKVFVDGEPVGEGGDPARLSVFPASAAPGDHEITVELSPKGPGAWFSLGMRTQGTNVTTGKTWEYVRQKPAGWPARGASATQWKPVESGQSMFPQMQWWAFEPNAFINMQGGLQVLQPYSGWDKDPSVVTYLRYRFTEPAR